jgi:hypothetical protein
MLLFSAGAMTDPITNNVTNRRALANWIPAISAQIENYLNRTLTIGNEVEYFDILFGKMEFFVKRIPVITVTTVELDPLGIWSGTGFAQLPYIHPGQDYKSIVIQHPLIFPCPAKNALRFTYNGGLANSGINSGWTLSTNTGTWAAGNYVIGTSSGACGIVVSYVGATKLLTLENYYGQFQAGETITGYSDEGTTATGDTNTIVTLTSPSLVDVALPIVQACEMQIRYMFKHQTDLENMGTNKDGTTLRRKESPDESSQLLPEVEHMLSPYGRPYL